MEAVIKQKYYGECPLRTYCRDSGFWDCHHPKGDNRDCDIDGCPLLKEPLTIRMEKD